MKKPCGGRLAVCLLTKSQALRTVKKNSTKEGREANLFSGAAVISNAAEPNDSPSNSGDAALTE